MKYSNQQILDFVYDNGSWAVTDGCPCISAPYDGNEIYVCLFQNDDCEDFIEIEVISTKQVEHSYGIVFENNSEYIKEYCIGEEHHDKLKQLYNSYHQYRMTA